MVPEQEDLHCDTDRKLLLISSDPETQVSLLKVNANISMLTQNHKIGEAI